MKKIILFIPLIIICLRIFSQAEISSQLLNEIEKNKNEYVNINIFFENLIKIENIAKKLDAENASFDKRVKTVTNYSKNNSEISVKNFYQLINNSEELKNSIKNEKVFWILNVINADVKIENIVNISRLNGVKYIDINSPRFKLIAPIKSQISEEKFENGAESSLYRINADKLWAMGYSGRNTLFLSVDTGVEVEHPAINNNYAGNYLPQSQCWYAVRHQNPMDNDVSNTHGTHTTGTVLGLDHNKKDTIGVAFNAHFIATDPVASNVNEYLTPEGLLSVFEWALDPDGNPNTTSDVPRAINNSWGYDYSYISNNGCDEVYADLLITIEAAGIASPFSAGNEGADGISTIGFPAVRAFNRVNPMAIGALNANNTIAYFSSKGPTPCTIEDSLIIKPEVSAPGVNIRSCYSNNGYAWLQGTSMACPHVTGALLLLVEAFPDASAYELKNALYQTAIDLGEIGEDNIFGMGAIDVYAAYQYLAQTYTPKPPIENNYDLVTEILTPNENLLCKDGEDIKIVVAVKNIGNQEITNYYLKYYVNDIFIDSIAKYVTLNFEDQLLQNININASYFNTGKNKILVVAKPFDNIEEYDIYNNGFTYTFNIIKKDLFPLVENFSAITDINDLKWLIINEDRSNTWQILPWGEYNEYQAIGIKFKEYFNSYAEDFLLLPKINLSNENNLYLYLKYAYKKFGNLAKNDSLFVSISNDCGKNFTEIYKNGGKNFGTVAQTNGYEFFKPTSINDFSNIFIDISEYKNQDIILQLKTKNDQGSVLYIDSLAICKLDYIFINENIENQIKIYPNPTNNFIKIQADIQDDMLEIYDINGKLVEKIKFSNEININCTNFANGIYTIIFVKNNIISKFIKK